MSILRRTVLTLLTAGTLAFATTNVSADTQEIRVDFATYNPVSLVLKERGILEQALAKDGIKVRWVQSLGSNKALEFLNAGSIDFGSTAVTAACVDQRCQSRGTDAAAPCGEQTCTASQYCEEFVGGPAGSMPSYTCKPLGDCHDCACLNVVGCQCSELNGAVKVFCAAP